MKNPIALLVLSLTLAACGGGSSGSPSVTVTGPSSNFLKIGEVTNFTATFKEAAGAAVSKTFTWTSSAPNIAEVDSSTGKVTTKRLGKVMVSASSDGVTGSSAVQQTYGLEVIGGTAEIGALGLPTTLATLFRFRVGSVNPITANTAFDLTFTGPADWNGGVAAVSKGWKMGAGGVSFWTQPAQKSTLKAGTYQASTTINGVTYTSSFTVDPTQLQARVTSITQTNITQAGGFASGVSASWTAAAGAAYYQMLISNATSFVGTSSGSTNTNATIIGLSLDITKPHSIYVIGTNFNYAGGLDTPAPAQFNASYENIPVTF
jgi:Bacterial Ig-like domain (group 2)